MTPRSSLLALLILAALGANGQTPSAKTTPTKKPAAASTQQSATSGITVGGQRISIPPLPKFQPQKPVRIALPNGLVIFLQEDHELPLIDGTIRIRGGERLLPANKAGMMAIYGGSWRTGGTESKTGDQLDDVLEARAAKVETGAAIESSSVSWSCLKGDFAQVFAAVLDVLQHPAFRQEKIDLAKRQLTGAIARRNDDLRGIAGREANRLGYGPQNPYARLAQYDTVAAITRDDLINFHKRTVVPNNMIIGVVGDFDAAQMEATLRQAFAAMPRGEPVPAPNLEFQQARPGLYYADKEDVNQAAIRMVALTPLQRKDPDFYAVSVMDQAYFSGGLWSRFTNEIRTKRGLAYAAGGSFSAPYDHPGIFEVSVDTKSTTAIEAVQAMRDALKDAASSPVTGPELQRAKDSLLNSFIFRYDSKEKLLAEQMFLEFYAYPLDLLEQFPARIQAVTAADVNRVAAKYIHPEQLAVLIVGNSAEFGKPLTALGEVTKLDISIPPPTAAVREAAAPAASPASAADQAMAGKALLAKVIQALGGADKINALTSLQIAATVQTPQGEVRARETMVYPDKLRQELETPGGAMSVVVTPGAAFATMGPNSQDLPGSMRQEMQADMKRDLIYIAKHAGDPAQTVTAGDGEKLGEVQAQVLKVTNGAISVQFDVDPASGRVLRARYTSMRPTGPADTVAELSDWRSVGGIMFPFAENRKENGEDSTSVKVTDIKLNPAVDPAQFEKPAAGASPK